MSLFALDCHSVLQRVRSSGKPAAIPSRTRSVVLGSLLFGAASLAVYATWAFGGRWMYAHLGEAGAYAVWAALFILLSGVALNSLVIGPRTLVRFYGLFLASFGAYALLWSLGWFALRGRAGEWVGSLAGIAAMGFVMANAFGLGWARWRMLGRLFVAHSAGYFLGSFLFDFCRSESGAELLSGMLDRGGRSTLGKLLWGAAYGLGFGAGLGDALYVSQTRVREELQEFRKQLSRSILSSPARR
jgi:hypothetical protein